ncbi:hypothetical protein Ddc_16456 [Ditylenchus destructor]|nr:hypothetical protein Ddc_16456 [Ditylenchus destructor]
MAGNAAPASNTKCGGQQAGTPAFPDSSLPVDLPGERPDVEEPGSFWASRGSRVSLLPELGPNSVVNFTRRHSTGPALASTKVLVGSVRVSLTRAGRPRQTAGLFLSRGRLLARQPRLTLANAEARACPMSLEKLHFMPENQTEKLGKTHWGEGKALEMGSGKIFLCVPARSCASRTSFGLSLTNVGPGLMD